MFKLCVALSQSGAKENADDPASRISNLRPASPRPGPGTQEFGGLSSPASDGGASFPPDSLRANLRPTADDALVGWGDAQSRTRRSNGTSRTK